MQIYVQIVFLFLNSLAFGYEGPSPLRDIKVTVAVSSLSAGRYKYDYKILNPASNNAKIRSMSIFLAQDAAKDLVVSEDLAGHCPNYLGSISDDAKAVFLMPSVGSTAPAGWSCTYAQLEGYSSGAYSWGSDEKHLLSPGSEVGGFSLTSFALPSIREVLIQPEIQYDKLSSEYEEDVDKIVSLKKKIKWTGMTIGPKAPPKVFDGASAVKGLSAVIVEAEKLGWLKTAGLFRSLEAKLEAASKKLESDDRKTALNILNALLNEVEAQKGKNLSAEAYALLYYNLDYILKQLSIASPVKTK